MSLVLGYVFMGMTTKLLSSMMIVRAKTQRRVWGEPKPMDPCQHLLGMDIEEEVEDGTRERSSVRMWLISTVSRARISSIIPRRSISTWYKGRTWYPCDPVSTYVHCEDVIQRMIPCRTLSIFPRLNVWYWTLYVLNITLSISIYRIDVSSYHERHMLVD